MFTVDGRRTHTVEGQNVFSGQKETKHMNVDLLIWKNMAEREGGGGGGACELFNYTIVIL